jgi:hypothetical protein
MIILRPLDTRAVTAMTASLRITLVISCFLVSCAKTGGTAITVQVADAFSGLVRIDACVKDAHENVTVDERGYGTTSACPSGDLDLVVVRRGKIIPIPPDRVSVVRTGDGMPIVITANIP